MGADDEADPYFIEVVKALLECINDKDDSVSGAVASTICKLASTNGHLDEVILEICRFIDNSGSKELGNLLQAIESICMQNAQSVGSVVVPSLVALLVKRMTEIGEYVPSVQMSSSGALVALGRYSCKEVTICLMEHLQPGVLPHYTIPHTIGALALANFQDMRPFIKNVLGKMLPTLGMLKSDPLKQAFSFALANFCIGFVDNHPGIYDKCESDKSDKSQAVDNEINTENTSNNENNSDDILSTEFSIIFDVLFNQWLYSHESSVVVNVLQAIGPMINLISDEKQSELSSKLVPNVLAIFKKPNVDPYFVTQALSCILMKSIKSTNLLTSSTGNSIIESIHSALFSHIVTLPDYDQSQKLKNHFETLRCFDILLKVKYPNNATLEFLMLKCKSNYEEDVMRAIVVLTHMVVSSDVDEIVISNFKSILKEKIGNECNVKMKRILLKGVVALAYKWGPFQESDATLIEFIIKNISHQSLNNDDDIRQYKEEEKLEIENFHTDCESSLYLLTSTVTNFQITLWPFLLKALMESKSNVSIAIITKCLTQQLLTKELEKETDHENTITHNVPSNEAIFVRCFSILNRSTKDILMSRNIIIFLCKYCSHFHKDLAVSWEVELKHLNSYLDSNDIEFSSNVWESMILDVFRSAIYSVNDNFWVEMITQAIVKQITTIPAPVMVDQISQKGILYKFLAILLCNMVDNNDGTIENNLNIIFDALPNCTVFEEDKYIAQSLGIASVKHGMRIVEKLDDMCKAIDSKKMSRFLKFSFIKSPKQDLSVANMRLALTLCYGEVANELLDTNILSRLVKTEKEGFGMCVRWILNIIQNNSSPVNLIQAALTTLYYLAKAVNTISPNFILAERWLLLNVSLDRLSEKLELEYYYPVAIKAISSLTKLPDRLTPEERNAVLKILYVKLYNALTSMNENDIGKNTFIDLSKDKKNLLEDIQVSLELIITDFMVQSTCPSTLDDMLSALEEWIIHENREVRISAMKSFQCTLNAFIQNIKLTYENPSRFNQSGAIIGRIVPRCTDEDFTIRKTAMQCIEILIRIIDLYEGHSLDPECEGKLKNLRDKMESKKNYDHKDLSKIMSDIGNIISNKIQHQQILFLIESLLWGLQAGGDASVLGCNVVLNIIFSSKGHDMYQNSDDVMSFVLSTLPNLKMAAKESLLQTMMTFVKHHPKNVVHFLLVQPLPFEEGVKECWSVLAQSPSIAILTFDIFLNILINEPIFEDTPKYYESDKVASVQCLAAMCGMCEMLSQPYTKSLCEEKFCDIFSCLYTIMICFDNASSPAHSIRSGNKKIEKFGFVPNNQSIKILPIRIAADTMKALLINTNCTKIIDVFLCNELDSPTYFNRFFESIRSVVHLFCKEYPRYLPKLVTSLNQFSRSPLIPQRIAVVAFFSHLVEFRCNDNLVIVETVIAALNAGWKDTSSEVRAASLSGLSNVRYLKEEQRQQLAHSVISSLYHSLDDDLGSTARTNIPLVAMINIMELLLFNECPSMMNDDSINLYYIKIALRIKAFMNVENALLRDASIRLFGEIVLQKRNDESLKEQSFNLLSCFLLHLADDDENVVKVCKQTLRKIVPTLEAPNANAMVQNHLIDDAKLHRITEFITDLTKCISNELPQNVPQLIESTYNYMNSPWDSIRSHAAIMIGLLFTSYKKESDDNGEYEKTHKMIIFRLLQLLKDKTVDVRISAAKAISGLY